MATGCFVLAALLAGTYGYHKFYKAPTTAEMLNISCFVFRDINRNGLYDLGDRPYAGLALRMDRPDADPVSVESNISGFANFRMAARVAQADVRTAGSYTITAAAPAGWRITSGNAVQSASFRLLEAAPVGIVADTLFVPIGVAPDLTISGRVAIDPAAPEASRGTLRAISPRGASVVVPMAGDGRFSLPAETGDWQLVHTSTTGNARTRTLQVGDYAVVVSALSDRGGATAPKRTRVTVDFDSLTTSDTLFEIPRGYGGLNWSNWVALHQKRNGAAGYVNGAVSAEYVAYNSSGHPASFGSAQAFDLAGLHLAVARPDAEQHDVIIRAWRGETLVHEDRLRTSTAGPLYFDADYRDITRVELSSAAYWQVVIDDLVYRSD